MIISFEIPIVPISGQLVKFTDGHAYRPKKIQEYKDAMRSYVMDKYPDFVPSVKEVVVTELTYSFLYPMSYLKADKVTLKPKYQDMLECGMTLYKTSKPDLHDNVQKPFFDAFTGILFRDDAQVCEIHARKIYSDRAYIKATIVLYE